MATTDFFCFGKPGQRLCNRCRADGRIALAPDSPSWHGQIRRLRAKGVIVTGDWVRRPTIRDELDAAL